VRELGPLVSTLPVQGHTLGVGKRMQERHLGPLFVDVGKIHQRSRLLNLHGRPDLSRQRCELLQPSRLDPMVTDEHDRMDIDAS
jgi:hypothetical protein